MRCPHCRGEIPPESQFCGVCGQNIHISQIGLPSAPIAGPGPNDAGLSPSLFDLPVSQGARAVRVAMVLGLNLLMLGGGIALFAEYLHKRDRVASGAILAKDGGASSRSNASPAAGAVTDAGPAALPPNSTAPGADGSSKTPAAGHARPDGGSRTPSSGTVPAPSKDDAGPSRVTPTRRPDAGTVPSTSPTRGAPDAGLGAARVETDLTPEEQARAVSILAGKIGLVVQQHQAQLGRCYENALKQGSPKDPMEGRINLHFSVQPDGSATGIRVRSNETGSESLATCLVGLVGSWTFPSSGSEAADFVWPFEFQAPQ